MQNRYDMKDLLTVKLKKTKNSYRLEGNFGQRYTEVFGDKYYDVWIRREEKDPVFLIEFTKELDYFPELFDGAGDVLLSHFYFNPSKYRENDMGGDKYWKLLTTKEREFYKGKGLMLLCNMLKEMLKDKFIKKSDDIILEASGGNSAKDMEQLVKYYKTLSFSPHTTNKVELQKGYESFGVAMITKVSELQKKCT
jgi:hypothetical protein